MLHLKYSIVSYSLGGFCLSFLKEKFDGKDIHRGESHWSFEPKSRVIQISNLMAEWPTFLSPMGIYMDHFGGRSEMDGKKIVKHEELVAGGQTDEKMVWGKELPS